MPIARRDHSSLQFPCGYLHCTRHFKTQGGHKKHWNTSHPIFRPAPATTSISHTTTVEEQPEVLDGHFPAGHDDISAGGDNFPEGISDPSPALDEPDIPDDLNAEFFGPGDRLYHNYHPKLNARPCNVTGRFLADGAPPTPPPIKSPNDWAPYRNRVEFETAEFLYTRNQMSAGDINTLLDLWAATLLKHNDKLPFADYYHDLYKTIDAMPVGDVKWQSLKVQYTGEKPKTNVLPWMDQFHDVIWNMLGNLDYTTEMDYWPYHEYSTDGNEHQWQDFMSGDWAWNQVETISEDPDTLGSTFVPVVLGSDKTTVSVATGANDYYPLYVSIRNVRNNVRHAHRDAVAIIGFLAMPKTTEEHAKDPKFRKFHRQLFHSSVAKILENLRPGMTTPEVVHFGDRHYRHVIYGLGPYIADYEEQVLLACIMLDWCPSLDTKSLCRRRDHTEVLVEEATYGALWTEYGIVGDLVPFTNNFPCGDIHELIVPDILHQLIKGTFKDHLVKWVGQYLQHVHGTKEAEKIQADIDQRIAAVASFAGLRRFPEGRGFKQWTGDDLKALMKVYLPAIEGHVPTDVVRMFRAFLEFCYLIWRNIITESTLGQIQEALDRFHHYRQIFESMGVVFMFSPPRQHSCSHYILLIRLFGAPNGLCSSITEMKHIKAVKEPWRRSSRYKALGQMLVTNQRLVKLAAALIDFKNHGMLNGTCLSVTLKALMPVLFNADVTIQGDNEDGEIDNGPTLVQAHVQLAKTHCKLFHILQIAEKCACTIPELSMELSIPNLYNILHRFLFEQVYPDNQCPPSEVRLSRCPRFDGNIQVFNSASSTFYAPSNCSGIGGMRHEHIRACPMWRNEAPQYDCVFFNTDASVEGMGGMEIACVMCFFSFTFNGVSYPCAVVHWFDKASDRPDQDTGMWIVTPLFDTDHSFSVGIIHIDSIYHAAHLIPIYGAQIISCDIKHYDSYDAFQAFYLNKFADHHAFEIAS
ncbi:uncharacterized protein F5891DRAFT_1127522 [Suillus fuscotomentosus]|uniref:C2H2-type domain-containing protein n=1 Tax=Suillus fuscotomentosus TaxID=1912939 RepID=A0AAD4HN22_9AGAM|nr:uncharacterized protein F5891DRAFT_1127522 [Suillus fuscotomentosus]KAG1902517.1 hypothetical protein F5891DRAFT_1127522 [Suillus fuscotomentosus]